MAAVILLAAVLSLSGCGDRQIQAAAGQSPQASYDQLSDIPEFYGEPYVTLSGNEPDFSPEDMAADSFENYSQLDSLGRVRTGLCDDKHQDHADCQEGEHRTDKAQRLAYSQI